MVNITKTNMNTTSSPAEIVGSIDDLLTEFFLRIPLKPLFQLKLVSKRWNSLISDPKLHSSRNDNKLVGFIFHNPDNTKHKIEKAHLLSLEKSSPVGPPSITELNISKFKNKIFHSCKGLLVGYRVYTDTIDSQDIDDDEGNERNFKDYFVYNPTTREYKSIPSPGSSIHWMYLAFDPSDSPHYNVVCVFEFNPYQFKLAVYSSKTHSWKKYDNILSSELMNFRKGVYWNGSIHWISFSKTEKSIYFSPHHPDNACGHSLTVFVMPTPPILDGYKSNNYFGESCDHLNFISYYERDDDNKLKVYEMRRDYSKWFVKYNVDVGRLVPNRRSFAVCGLVRGKKGDDEDDESFLVLLIKRRMIRYNVVAGTFEIISEFDEMEKKDQKEKGEENNGVYDKFKAFKSGLDWTELYCPLQYIESLCLV